MERVMERVRVDGASPSQWSEESESMERVDGARRWSETVERGDVATRSSEAARQSGDGASESMAQGDGRSKAMARDDGARRLTGQLLKVPYYDIIAIGSRQPSHRPWPRATIVFFTSSKLPVNFQFTSIFLFTSVYFHFYFQLLPFLLTLYFHSSPGYFHSTSI